MSNNHSTGENVATNLLRNDDFGCVPADLSAYKPGDAVDGTLLHFMPLMGHFLDTNKVFPLWRYLAGRQTDKIIISKNLTIGCCVDGWRPAIERQNFKVLTTML